MGLIQEIEDWLKTNKIEYFKAKSGLISVDLSDIPDDIWSDFHEFCYNIQKKYT